MLLGSSAVTAPNADTAPLPICAHALLELDAPRTRNLTPGMGWSALTAIGALLRAQMIILCCSSWRGRSEVRLLATKPLLCVALFALLAMPGSVQAAPRFLANSWSSELHRCRHGRSERQPMPLAVSFGTTGGFAMRPRPPASAGSVSGNWAQPSPWPRQPSFPRTVRAVLLCVCGLRGGGHRIFSI